MGRFLSTGRGSPLSSETVPEMALVCAKAVMAARAAARDSNILLNIRQTVYIPATTTQARPATNRANMSASRA